MCKNPSELNKFKRLLYEAKKFIVAIASLRPCYGIRKNIVQVFSEAGGVGWKGSDRLFSEAQSFLASVVFLGSILYELVIVLGGNIVFNDRIHKHFPVIPYEECLLFKILELYGYPKKCITLEDLNQAFIPEVVGDFLFIAKGIGCIYPIKGRVHVKHHAVEIESVLETIDKLFSLQDTLFKKIEKIEIWNLVFKQFETLANGERNKLPKTLIERMCR